MADSARPTAEAPADMDLSGRELGGYRLLRRLGRGAMAEVYLAEQTSLRRQVALKVLRSNLATDEMYVRRFHLEAQAAASLVHANIVQIHEVGCADGIHFIAQEYVQGVNLHELLVRRGPPDLKLALGIMRQVTAALHKAAEQGIVHRDIKPENIMLASSGEVKVADFGLARITRDDSGLNLTQIGFTMGTPLYMSPEQVEGKPLDPRSDIYSFGVTCYHMLTGEAPFRGETALSVAVQHLKNQPQRLEQLRPDLPAALCRIIHRMLAKNPDDRYLSARELLRDLRALRIAGVEDDLDEQPDSWPDDVLAAAAVEARQAATEQLAVLMRTAAMPVISRRSWSLAAILATLAAIAGVAIAWRFQEPSLLAFDPAELPRVEKQDTIEQQYFYASMVDTIEAWKSVEEHFGANHYLSRRAKQRLAMLYLEEDDYDQSYGLFTQFAEMNELERDFRAFGLAGQAIVLAYQRKSRESADKLAELIPYRQNLDNQMRGMIAQLLVKNRVGFGEQTLRNWEKWLQTPDVGNSSGPNPTPSERVTPGG